MSGEPKPFWKSRRFWGALILAVGRALTGQDVELGPLIEAAGGGVALLGAARANGPLVLR